MANIHFINLLTNQAKFQTPVDQTMSNKSEYTFNEKHIPVIITAVNDRLKLGKERYGHGVIVDTDTTKFGTPSNDLILMALEEMLDGLVYISASIIRLNRKSSATTTNNEVKEDDNIEIMAIITEHMINFEYYKIHETTIMDKMLVNRIETTDLMLKYREDYKKIE